MGFREENDIKVKEQLSRVIFPGINVYSVTSKIKGTSISGNLEAYRFHQTVSENRRAPC